MFPSDFSPPRPFLLLTVALAGLYGAASSSPSAFGATQAIVPPALVETESTVPTSSAVQLYPAEFVDVNAIPPAEFDDGAPIAAPPSAPAVSAVSSLFGDESPFQIDPDASPFRLGGGSPPFRLPDAAPSGGVQIFEIPETKATRFGLLSAPNFGTETAPNATPVPESDALLFPGPTKSLTADVETVKLDPYFSRSPSSWATTSIREGRNSLFQSVGFEASSAANTGAVRCGLLETRADVTLGLPLPTVQTPLLVSPTFAWTQIETPESLPTPFDDKLSLFSQGLAFQYYVPLNERLLLNVNVNAFYNTDYHSSASDAWFFNGYAAAAWKINPTTNLLFGVYHNPAAESWKTIPVGGLVWKPRDDFYLEAMIPYPKIAKRVDLGVVDENINASPHWIYVAGEVGGNIWAFETASLDDVASRPSATPNLDAELAGLRRDAIWAGREARVRYFDFRIFAGIETKTGRDVDWALEAGVALARELTIQTIDGGPEFNRRYTPNAVGIVRFRASY
ncbi:MAG: hypothetical protein IJ991_06740 [Thermoguttaceae bacterium]|nr:hypothetical protein [Thermoguttaceae bacterium]